MNRNPPQEAHQGRASSPKRPPSAHWAFIYATSLPGVGEIYAGALLRGILTLSLFMGSLTWFIWFFLRYLEFLFSSIAAAMYTGMDVNVPTSIYVHLVISAHVAYLLWLWAMFAAVLWARRKRLDQGLAPQKQGGWGLAMAWLSPGTGHAYMGRNMLGYAFFAVHALLALAMLGVYAHFWDSLRAMVAIDPGAADGLQKLAESGMAEGIQNLTDPRATQGLQALVNAVTRGVSARMLHVTYSAPQVFKNLVVALAVVDTAFLVRGAGRADTEARPAEADPATFAQAEVMRAAEQERLDECGTDSAQKVPWTQQPFWRALGHAGASLLCPGAGHMLQGRMILGWITFGLYLGSQGLLALLLGLGLVTPDKISDLGWIPMLIKGAAVVDAFVWHLLVGRNRSQAQTVPFSQR